MSIAIRSFWISTAILADRLGQTLASENAGRKESHLSGASPKHDFSVHQSDSGAGVDDRRRAPEAEVSLMPVFSSLDQDDCSWLLADIFLAPWRIFTFASAEFVFCTVDNYVPINQPLMRQGCRSLFMSHKNTKLHFETLSDSLL